MSAREALGVILSDGVAQLLANEAVVEDGTDPEGVHQARVAVRRTRAALSAFKPVIERGPRKPLARKLRWLQQALGPARDWDVFLEETLGPVLKAAPESEGLRGLEKRSAKRRTKGYKQALKAIHSKRYQRLLIALEGWVFTDNPDAERRAVGGFAQDLLEARYRAVLTDGGADPTALPTEALHRLRIEIKKLRYAVEFFRSLYAPDEVAGFLQAVKKLQDCLGGLNDAVVAHRLLQDLAGGAEDPARVLDADAVRAIEAAQAEKIETGLAKLSAMWARFGEQPVFWESAAEAPPVSPAPAGARSG
jgi:CHAD domain-containing protein